MAKYKQGELVLYKTRGSAKQKYGRIYSIDYMSDGYDSYKATYTIQPIGMDVVDEYLIDGAVD